MFIEIDDSLFDRLKNNTDIEAQRRAREVLLKLCLAVHYGKHNVYYPRLTQRFLSEVKVYVSQEVYAIMDVMRVRRQDLSIIKQYVSIYSEVTYNSHTSKNAGVITINPDENPDFEFYEESHVLGENLNDVMFYQKVALCYLSQNPFAGAGHVRLNLFPLHGGGKTSKGVLKKEIEWEQHFCYCITDSDKHYDAAGIVGTPADLMACVAGNPFNCEAHVLSSVSEVENLIPYSYISQQNNGDWDVLQTKDLSYFDFKKGIHAKDLIDTGMYNYWEPVFAGTRLHEVFEKVAELKSLFIGETDAALKEIAKDNTYCNSFISGWGNSLFSEYITSNDFCNLGGNGPVALTVSQQSEWDYIGKAIFSWCNCMSPVRI